MALESVELVGQRIELVSLELDHADALYEVGAAPEIWRFLPRRVSTKEDMVEWVADALRGREAGDELPFAVRERFSKRIVGSTRLLDYVPEHRQIEIGWTWLTPEVWRQGFNTEIKFLLLRQSFEQLHMIRVQITADARNLISRRSIERIGANLDGVLRKQRIMPDNYVRDSAYYSVIDDEWPAMKQHLIELLSRPGLPVA